MIHKRTLSNFSTCLTTRERLALSPSGRVSFGLSLAYHPQQDLAKFGYKPSVQVKEINNSILFQLLLELVIEIWLIFIYLLENLAN